MSDALSPEIQHDRKTDYPIHPLIQNRWSPRAMTGEKIPDATLMSLFEAARWAPSSYDAQPWRFIYAKRETPAFDDFFNLMGDFNQSWAGKAAVLGVIIARTRFEKNDKPAPTHALDTGAAWENLFLEGVSRGLVVHGMEGFDYEKARQVLAIPAVFEVLAMFAIGKRAPKETLPPELQKRESPASSPRKKVSEFIMEGKFRDGF